MDTNELKNSVAAGYGKLAKTRKGGIMNKLFACCDLTENAKTVGKEIGYSAEEMSQVPEDSNLGIGCGNPSGFAKLQEGETVVDLGCGAGFDAFIVSQVVGPKGKVVGVDLSSDMIALANKNAEKGEYENIEFFEGDIEELPLPSQQADVAISNCVINLATKKEQVFTEAYRILRPGGRIAISDVVLRKELPTFVKDSLAGHLACVSGAEKLENYLEYIRNAGFEQIEIVRTADFPLELMFSDPQIVKLAEEMNFSLDSDQAKDIASRVASVSIVATKPLR